MPVLQKFSDTVGDGRAQAQTLAEPVSPLNKNESLAESLRAYKEAILDHASFESLLKGAAIFNNGNNLVLLNNIKEWQSTFKHDGKFLREKELAFAAAMQSLEETFKTCNQKSLEPEEVLKLTKYIVNHSPVPRFKLSDDDSGLLEYARNLRADLTPRMLTAPAVSFNLDPLQINIVGQTREQALKQLMSMCSASSSEKAMSSDNFGSAVEELRQTTFQDKPSTYYKGQRYEQKVIESLRQWDKAKTALDSCDRQKEPYLKLRLELLTGMVLQEILQSTDNNMEPFKDKEKLLQILDFMMKQPVTTSKEKEWLLPMFSQPGRSSWNPFNRNPQMPADTKPDNRLLSAFNDKTGWHLSGERVSVIQDYLKTSQQAALILATLKKNSRKD